MKIAHIAPPWIRIPPKNYGGTEAVIANLVEQQVVEGHEVTLLAPGDAQTSAQLVSFIPRSLIDSGVPWQGHLKAYYHLHKSVEYVKAHDFDILHIHLSSASDMYLFPMLTTLKTPHVTTLHSRFPFDRVQSWTGDADDYFKEWFLPAPMVAISENARHDVPYQLNFVGVVHHGLSMNFFKNKLKKPEPYFAWLGRFVPEKGAHLAIQAAQQMGIPLVLAGIVDRNLPEAVAYFEEQILPHVDGEQIQYIGPVNMRQKISLLSKAHGFLNPIQWEEPFGMVMIEAMAVGCPVISFARGAAPEIVTPGKTGFLVDTLEQMVECIPQVDELDRTAIREYVLENFSVKAMAAQYLRVYEHVIAMKAVSKRGSVRTKATVAPHALVDSTPSTLKTDDLAPAPFQISLSSTAKQEEKSPL